MNLLCVNAVVIFATLGIVFFCLVSLIVFVVILVFSVLLLSKVS